MLASGMELFGQHLNRWETVLVLLLAWLLLPNSVLIVGLLRND